MAFPYIHEANFEAGNFLEFDSETTDTLNRFNVRHYSYLAREDATKVGPIAPYRGAFCAEIVCGGETDAHQLIEGDHDIADTVSRWVRFALFIGNDFTATADDIFSIYEFRSAAAVERAVGLQITAATGAINLGIGEAAPSVFSTTALERGRWHWIEANAVIQTGGTGTGAVYLNGSLVASISGLTDLACTTGSLGTANVLSTTSGHLYFDLLTFDDAQNGPYADRYPETVMLNKSMHVCLGESDILNVTLLVGSATSTLTIYDTDSAAVSDDNIKAYLYNLTADEPPIDLADVPLCVKRGAYVVLAGADTQAIIHVGRSQGYTSHGRVRQLGSKRNPHQVATQ